MIFNQTNLRFYFYFTLTYLCVDYLKINENKILEFFAKQPSKILFSVFIVIAFFFSALTISEIFEDYLHDEKIKNVANKVLYLFAIVVPLLTILGIYTLDI